MCGCYLGAKLLFLTSYPARNGIGPGWSCWKELCVSDQEPFYKMSVLNVAETDILQQQNLWCLSCKKHCTAHRIYLFQLLFHLVPHASIFHGVLHFHTHRLGMHTEAGARALRALIGFDCPDHLHHHTLSPQLSFSTAQGL